VSAEHLPPRATPWARPAAVAIGFLLLAVAVVCAREVWLRNSRSIHWESWVGPLVETVGNTTYQLWMLPAGGGAVLLGLFLVWVACRPRTPTHLPVGRGATVWMRRVDIARMLSATARTVPGVATAASHVNGQTATVSVTGRVPDANLSPAVAAVLGPLLGELGLDLTLRVRQNSLEEVRP
jgi:hypothetical protein